MGNCATHEEFFAQFRYLIPELYRVMKPGRNVSFHCMLMPSSKERDGFIGEGQMSYAGPGAQSRGQLALDLVRQRLAGADYAHFESRYDLIGVNAIFLEALNAILSILISSDVREKV